MYDWEICDISGLLTRDKRKKYDFIGNLSNHGAKSMFCATYKGKTHGSNYTTAALIKKVRGYRNE